MARSPNRNWFGGMKECDDDDNGVRIEIKDEEIVSFKIANRSSSRR